MDFLSGNIIQILEIAGTILGLIYLYYEYRASSSLWIVNIIMSAIYTLIYFSEGIYALGCLSIYNILAAIYGILVWKYSKTSEQKELHSQQHCHHYSTYKTSIVFRILNSKDIYRAR